MLSFLKFGDLYPALLQFLRFLFQAVHRTLKLQVKPCHLRIFVVAFLLHSFETLLGVL